MFICTKYACSVACKLQLQTLRNTTAQRPGGRYSKDYDDNEQQVYKQTIQQQYINKRKDIIHTYKHLVVDT